jgi:hypothetical protein
MPTTQLKVTRWLPRRQPPVEVTFDEFRRAVAGTGEEVPVGLVLESLERGEVLNGTGASILGYAASVCPPEAFPGGAAGHETDSGPYGGFTVALAGG